MRQKRLIIYGFLLTAIFLLALAFVRQEPTPAYYPTTIGSIAQIYEGRSMRSSSSDPDIHGNRDAWSIKAGESATIADLKGPGVITHIWFTLSTAERNWGRYISLRMYWDGNPEPAVESPLGDFFANGHAMHAHVNSVPVQVSSQGRAFNCFWPMPFRKSARIVVTNESKKEIRALYFYVDWIKLDKLPPNTAYFHAQYRQEYPGEATEEYIVFEGEGQGHYVGTVFSAILRRPSWFGEGDDRFYIDGEEVASLLGTGTEDYLCTGYNIRPMDRLYNGVSIREGGRGEWFPGARITFYRWHINDPVVYKKSLRFAMEHTGYGFGEADTGGPNVRRDYYSSVAFWYQVGKAKRYAKMPPAEERMLPAITIEPETFFDKIKFYPQQKARVRHFRWPLGEEVFFANRLPGGYMEVPFEVPEKGIYNILLYFTTHKDHAIVDVHLDGIPVARGFDTFSLPKMERQFSIGARELDKGTHILRLTAVDNHKDAAIVYSGKMPVTTITPSGAVSRELTIELEERNIGYFIALDAIVLEKFSLGEGVSPLT